MAVEHQVRASAGALETPDNVGPAFLHLLPTHPQTHGFHGPAHIAGHLQFFTGGAGNVDDVAAHRDETFLIYLGKYGFGEIWIRHRVCLSCGVECHPLTCRYTESATVR